MADCKSKTGTVQDEPGTSSVQSLSHVRLFTTPWTIACQAPLSIGILQARILEWVAMPSSRGSSQLRDWSQVSCIAGRSFTVWAPFVSVRALSLKKAEETDWYRYDCGYTIPNIHIIVYNFENIFTLVWLTWGFQYLWSWLGFISIWTLKRYEIVRNFAVFLIVHL